MSLPTLQLEGLKAAAFWDGDNIKLTFIGEIDLENPAEVLDPFLEEVHRKASSKTTEVSVNLKELKFMNSSGIKAFLKWISMVTQAETPYKIHFQCNPNFTWQKTSLGIIQRIASQIVTIEN